MKAKQFSLTWICILTVSFLVLINLNCPGENSDKLTDLEKRSDIIPIESMTQFGELERPKVLFPHDLHTQALVIKSDDCLSCHLKAKNYLSLTFKRPQNADPAIPDKDVLMDIYHSNCIGCHKERVVKNETAGPITCGQCHVKSGKWEPVVDPMGFDRSLHYRHVKTNDKKCDTCHHEYDEKTKKLIYVKGKEGTCRYCHQQADEENRISFQKTAHLSCIACHQQKLDAGLSSGPVNCRGCHDKKEKSKIKIIDPVPRMERTQPDTVFVKRFFINDIEQTAADNRPSPSDYRMPLVPYDHKAHEAAGTTCRGCHHAAMTPCAGCHLLAGADTDNAVNLEQAMHQTAASASCKGCHNIQKNEANCRGCHQLMVNTQFKSEEQCATCHVERLTDGMDDAALSALINDTQKAKQLLEKLQKPGNKILQSDIPEIVKIGTLEDKYHPVDMPHRKIVNSLLANIEGSRLATVFHKADQKTCKACHHSSPESVKPPKCASCHGKAFNDQNIHMPGLMGAYHQQCMECHKAMEITKPLTTDCTGCHKEKKKSNRK